MPVTPESTHGMNDKIDGREFFVIYMDNAATTRLSGRALEAMMPYLTEQYANPAGTYSFTHASNAAMEKARKQVADVIGDECGDFLHQRRHGERQLGAQGHDARQREKGASPDYLGD